MLAACISHFSNLIIGCKLACQSGSQSFKHFSDIIEFYNISGKHEAGERLMHEKLTKKLAVSQTPLREALQ
ncbi:MAG TPA: GntR family transcriptional regulator, partial [bacterium]|nr:GntR family transcriptional regulator [bacterium]